MKFKLTWLCNILSSSSQFSGVVPQYVAILDVLLCGLSYWIYMKEAVL